MGVYQQDTVQTGITAIYSRQHENNVGTATRIINITGNVTTTIIEDGSYTCLSGSSTPGDYSYVVNQRNSNETRPSNASMAFGIYLGSSSEV